MRNERRGNADESNAIFVRAMPTIEISEDEIVFIGTAKGTFAIPLAQYRVLHRSGAVALAVHDGRADNVIPLCELCVRHDLPRHVP